MKKLLSLMMLMLLCTSAWAQEPTMLFHESFGNNTGSARDWNDSYSVKTGVEDVYSGITGYTVVNAKQGKNTTGSTLSGLNQSTQGSDASIVIGPLNVANYESLKLTYQWKAASVKGTYSTTAYYATSANGDYTEVDGTGDGATSFVERAYNLPVEAQVSTLYLKIVFNTSNTQAIIDEVNLDGIETGTAPAVTVAKPVIEFNAENPVEGDNVTCTITCATDGATIQYALNDGEFQAYDEPFTINTTTTVKAKAVLEVDGTTYESQEASKTITFAPAPTTAANIAAFNGLDDNTDLTFTGTVTAIAQKGNTLYVQDSEKGMLIYGSTGQTYKFGDIIPAGFKGTKTTYNGAPEMKNPTEFAAATEKAEPTPIEMTIDDITLDNFGRYGVIRGATIENGEIKVGDQTVTIAQTLGVEIPTEGTLFDIYGVVGWTNNARFLPTYYDDKTPFALTITPANYIGTESVKVTIAPYHAAEGNVEIKYTLDGSDPSLGEALTYSGPITITESCTLKAYAFDAQMNEASAEGTYVIVVPATKFKLVTDLTELEAGKQVLIAGVKESTTDGKTMYVMGKQNTNNRAAVEYGSIEEAPRNLNLTDGTVTGYFPMVLGKEGDYYTFYDYNDAANKGYLFASGSGSNNSLKKQEELNDSAKADLTLEDDGTFSVVFQGKNTNKYMQFNSGSKLFSCYGSASQNPVYLYVEGEMVEEPIAISVSPEPGTYTEPQTIQFTLTGVPEGETATITYVIGDGEQQTYTEPFTLYKSATITVMAKCGDKSDIQEYTYTINLPALAFEMTPAPGEYDTAQEVTIACTNAVSDLTVVWIYTPEEGNPIEGNETNMTFTAAKSGVLTIMAQEANTSREYNTPDEGLTYTITEPATTYTITLDKEPGDYTALVNVKATVEPALPEGATLTFKINDAEPKAYNPEKGVNMLESGTLTFTATDAAGNVLATTSAEYKYIMGVFGDLNNDGTVDVTEVGIIVNLILGKLNN